MSLRDPAARTGAAGLLFALVLTVTPVHSFAARTEASAQATAKHSGARAKTVKARTHAAHARGTAGMRIAIDPETGKPTQPTAEQRRAFAEQAAPVDPSSERLQEIQLADGTKLVRLGERGLMYSVARRDAQGRIQIGCLHSKEEVKRFVQPGSHSPAGERVEQ